MRGVKGSEPSDLLRAPEYRGGLARVQRGMARRLETELSGNPGRREERLHVRLHVVEIHRPPGQTPLPGQRTAGSEPRKDGLLHGFTVAAPEAQS